MFSFFKNDKEDLKNASIKLAEKLTYLIESVVNEREFYIEPKHISEALMAALNFVSIAGVVFGAQETLKKLDGNIINVGTKA